MKTGVQLMENDWSKGYWWHGETLELYGINDLEEINKLDDDKYLELIKTEFYHACEDLRRSLDFDKWREENGL